MMDMHTIVELGYDLFALVCGVIVIKRLFSRAKDNRTRNPDMKKALFFLVSTVVCATLVYHFIATWPKGGGYDGYLNFFGIILFGGAVLGALLKAIFFWRLRLIPSLVKLFRLNVPTKTILKVYSR